MLFKTFMMYSKIMPRCHLFNDSLALAWILVPRYRCARLSSSRPWRDIRPCGFALLRLYASVSWIYFLRTPPDFPGFALAFTIYLRMWLRRARFLLLSGFSDTHYLWLKCITEITLFKTKTACFWKRFLCALFSIFYRHISITPYRCKKTQAAFMNTFCLPYMHLSMYPSHSFSPVKWSSFLYIWSLIYTSTLPYMYSVSCSFFLPSRGSPRHKT